LRILQEIHHNDQNHLNDVSGLTRIIKMLDSHVTDHIIETFQNKLTDIMEHLNIYDDPADLLRVFTKIQN
jgi:hypothetical protein